MTIEEIKMKYPNVDIWTLSVKSKKGDTLTIHLREMDRVVYKAVSSLIQKDELMGVESFLKSLCVDGDVQAIIDDFYALRSAAMTILPMLSAEAGELKKN
jgi:hypothetical protein